MIIRKAEHKDINQILNLLSQVLEIHAKLRPDIFVSGTTKYNNEYLEKMMEDQDTVIDVAVESDIVLGYAIYEIIRPRFESTMKPIKTLYIDDLCVDEKYRGKHIGTALFEQVVKEAKELDCYSVNLYAWEGNEDAKRFYAKMGMKIKAYTMEYILK